MKTYVLFHASCLDGFGAAYAAWMVFGEDAEYIPVRYQEGWPDEVESDGNQVFILDFSYDRDTLSLHAQRAKNLIVIDHHLSAQKELADLPFATFDMEKSGAVLAWEFFHPDIPVPKLLLHLQDRDLWKFEMQGTEAICESLWSRPKDFHDWDSLIKEPGLLNIRKNEGRILLIGKRSYIRQQLYGKFSAVVAGHRTMVCNLTVSPSEACQQMLDDHPEVQFVVGFKLKSCGSWDWSFRSRKDGFDVSELAKKFGGGGHQSAAGARTHEIIFTRTSDG